MPTAPARDRRGQHEAANDGRMLDRGPKRHGSAEGESEQVGPPQPEVVDEGGDVVGHGLEPHRPVRGGRPAVALEVDADHAPFGGEARDVRPEHLDRAEPAVEDDEGRRPA